MSYDEKLQKKARELQVEADGLNDAMPPGTKIRYWSGIKEGPGIEGRVSLWGFTVLCGHTVIGWIYGPHGTFPCIASSHIEKA